VNGLGFQRNSDWLLVAGAWSYDAYPRGSWLRHWQVGTDNAGVGWSFGGERRASVVDVFVLFDFANYWGASLALQHEASVLSTEWLRGGPALELPPREGAKLSVHTDNRRTSLATLDATATAEPDTGSYSVAVSPSLTLRLSDHVAGTLGASYQDQVVGWQFVPGPPAGEVLVGRLHQRTLSLSLQTDIAITSRFIVQLYAQPFATIGEYSRYARLMDPRADRPEDRFAQLGDGEISGDATMLTVAGPPSYTIARPDASQRSLVATAVARWELAPGSFLTAVWSHRAEVDTLATGARLAGDLGDVLREPGADVFLVKLGWRWAP